ncbi:MAB_1171c family putative transporter [Streptomyces sp. NPDC093801]|uniref:MAB_1171c family putative transporter n=1 Tax=Streptomyces sp. NPDC093801 TaxID=3155203 RepID=UPI00344FB338
MADLAYYVIASLLLLTFALRVPRLLRHWRDPLVRSVAVLLPLAASVFFFAAPPTISQVNHLTGVTNFSAPLVYALVTALSAALINLTITWRGGPEHRRRTATRRCVAVYGAVIGVVFVLFAAGDASDERRLDFDTYYATAPYLREMVVLYIVAHALASLTLARLCWRWSREVVSLLRTGLTIMVAGSVVDLAYAAAKLLSVGARWAGRDWDGISTATAPALASLASLVQCVGLALPSVSQALSHQWRRWTQYQRLRPLWLAMRAITPYELVRIPWWSSIGKRHLRRTCDIRDGLRLLPYTAGHTDLCARTAAHGPGALKPGSEQYIRSLTAALESLHGALAHSSPDGFQSLLEGDEGLVRLSDALCAVMAPDEAALRREPFQGHPAKNEPHTGHPPVGAGRGDG